MRETTMETGPTATGANRATRTITKVLVSLLAFAGFEHGLFAALQGNRPTGGFGITTIGRDMQWWKYGGEDAVTIIPNFLATGMAAMAVSIVILIWAWRFMHRRHGVLVLLLLFILLTAVGGGVGFVPFFLVTCAYATRIDKPLNWWRKTLSPGSRRALAPWWRHALVAAAVCWLLAIEIAVFGYVPGQTDPEILITICWSLLLLTMILANVSYISGFADDIDRSAA